LNTKDFTLLFVEDDQEILEWMQIILENNFKEYYQASNGKEGLELYKKHRPDIVITDISMPLLGGLEMSKEIKKIDKNKPIIIMSAFDNKEYLLEAINTGIDYFISKPINVDILYDKINNVVTNLSNQREIEALKEQEMQNLYYLAHYDTLTGVQNRLLFEDNLKQALSRAKKMDYEIIFFFIDLDDFKNINDTYGHVMGDIVLQNVAKNIKNVIRIEDTFARISGDEFALIMEITNNQEYDIDKVAEKIIDALEKNIYINGNDIKMSCSIGISRFPQDAVTAEELLHRADIAMYEAKKSGKASYFHYNEKGK